MKKSIIIFALILSVSIISGAKEAGNKDAAKDLKSSGKADVRESKVKSPEAKPRILFLLSDDKKVVSSLWWKYDPALIVQPGC